MTATVTIATKAAQRIRAGYPWVYEQDVTETPATDADVGNP